MKLTLEQIKTDESVWPSGATHYKNYLFYKKTEGGWVDCTSNTLSWNSGKWFEDAAPRPTKDWLQANSEVATPKGTATVTKITEDDGVFTTLGNYCRSELSPAKAFVPEVGGDSLLPEVGSIVGIYLASLGDILIPHVVKGYKVWSSINNDSDHHRVFILLGPSDDKRSGNNERLLNDTHPIKSEREKFVEAAMEATGAQVPQDGLFEQMYDSGKFKLAGDDK